MRASELIEQLQRFVERNGDQPVFKFNDPGHSGDDAFYSPVEGCQSVRMCLSSDEFFAEYTWFDGGHYKTSILLT